MIIRHITPQDGFILHIICENQQSGLFDVSPYLDSEAFMPLRDSENFKKVKNGRYFIEWECGADLSADTIEAHWKVI